MLRRSVVPVLPLLLCSLLASGCGGDGDDSPEPPGVLSYREMKAALLEEGSAVGGAEVGPEDLPGFADDRQADREECQPLSAIVDLDPEPVRAQRVQADIKPLGSWVHAQLLSYAGDDAEAVLDQVDAAIDACAAGYVDTRIREFPVSKVAREAGPALGEEVVAYATTATDSMDDEPFPLDEHTVLVRDGQQVLAFRAGSLGEDEEARALLTAVVEAQWERYAATR